MAHQSSGELISVQPNEKDKEIMVATVGGDAILYDYIIADEVFGYCLPRKSV